MNLDPHQITDDPLDQELIPESGYDFGLGRRGFIKLVGAGLLITFIDQDAEAQQRGGSGGRGSGGRGSGGRPTPIAMRIHVGEDGTISVMTGKVEEGQGARAETALAAAEEMRVKPDRVRVVMSDTALVPDDGTTAGSSTTPRTIPNVRAAAACARGILAGLAAAQWGVQPDAVEAADGVVREKSGGRTISYGDLAKSEEAVKAFKGNIPSDMKVTPCTEWKSMGKSLLRPNLRDIVTGALKYASDTIRPGMLYGKVLRPPSFGAELTAIDLGPAQAMKDVTAVRDGNFVGCAAPTTYAAEQAIKAIAPTAQWKENPRPVSNQNLFEELKKKARGGRKNDGVETALAGAGKKLEAQYTVAYIQHTPMETRGAVAEWEGDKLTVWVGSDGPFNARGSLAGAFRMPPENIHVIVPEMGGGFGGKHTCDQAQEAARLAKAAGKPVLVKWTRAEEFTWAYCRPAALHEMRGALDAQGKLAAWDHVSINPGGSGIDAPYAIPAKNCESVSSDSPLAQGSYRCLAATANNFARESFIDELAAAAGADPLAFRLAHVDDRMKAVLQAAAQKFGWAERKGKKEKDAGIGLACGTEKGSVVAACVEVAVDRAQGKIIVKQVVEAFENGPVINPMNMIAQVKGCIIMGLGGALSEEMLFENGRILNASLTQYQVPRFQDVPPIEVILLNPPGDTLIGGGETPIIAIAPAIGNAVFAATGIRLRSMPMRLPAQA